MTTLSSSLVFPVASGDEFAQFNAFWQGNVSAI
jgi:hypothetical protein